MATRSAALPIERRYLLKAWLTVGAIVLGAVLVIAIALSAVGSQPGGSGGVRPPAGSSVEYQPQPIVVNGTVCGQCR
ncbi:MAG TPA: hypothetical protein VIC58_10410 [Actinomycetota bacterium]|jgi:hypothetical protein